MRTSLNWSTAGTNLSTPSLNRHMGAQGYIIEGKRFEFVALIKKMLKIWELPKDEEQAIGLLQEKGIIHEVRLCAKGHFMKLYVKKETQWVCRKKV